MTENEAIKILDTQKQCIDKSSSGQYKIHCGDCKKNIPITYQEKSYEVAITALKEIQQYRAIGTVEECRKAVEKQKAKKPLGGVDIAGNEYVICPHCSAIVEDGEWRADYCPDCGQAIRRDENLEETENEQIKFGVLL